MFNLINELKNTHALSLDGYKRLLDGYSSENAELLRKYANEERERIYGKDIFIRGLIEISNICKNDCLYCGIRKSNRNCSRYRLTKDEILKCCDEGYELGFRTFVLQGGEDGFFTDGVLCDIVGDIKQKYPDCAVTLSVGERSRESYELLFSAGADRYLLRHETANKEHYSKLHPNGMSYENRIRCLNDLKEIGYQVGCGFMVGSPYQTTEHLAQDLKFIEKFSPDMCGVGPFIPHKDTCFADFDTGTLEMTCYLLSIIRLIKPSILLPSTTALGTVSENGREKGILSGANVVMPNLSPSSVRKKYMLYDNKISDGAESAQSKKILEERINSIGCKIAVDRGDIKKG